MDGTMIKTLTTTAFVTNLNLTPMGKFLQVGMLDGTMFTYETITAI